MLDDLTTRVDATDNRLTRANKRMQQFIRQNEGTASRRHLRLRAEVALSLRRNGVLMVHRHPYNSIDHSASSCNTHVTVCKHTGVIFTLKESFRGRLKRHRSRRPGLASTVNPQRQPSQQPFYNSRYATKELSP